jgi:hypothetical protein
MAAAAPWLETLAGLKAASEAQCREALEAFVTQYWREWARARAREAAEGGAGLTRWGAAQSDTTGLFDERAEAAALSTLVALVREQEQLRWDAATRVLLLRAVKILLRDQRGYPELCRADNLCGVVALLAALDDPGAREALSLLNNCLFLHRAAVTALFLERNLATPLLAELRRRDATATKFIAARVLMMLTIEEPAARAVGEQGAAVAVAEETVARCEVERGLPRLFTPGADAAANHVAHGDDRKLVEELFRVMLHLMREGVLRASLEATLTQRLYKAWTRCVVGVLGLGESNELEPVPPSGRPHSPLMNSAEDSLFKLKNCASHTLLTLPDGLAPALVASGRGLRGLVSVLDVAAQARDKDVLLLACSATLRVVQKSEVARRYLLRFVFGAQAELPEEEAARAPLGMAPQGLEPARVAEAESGEEEEEEGEEDKGKGEERKAGPERPPAPATLREVLLRHMTSFSANLKRVVEELLWALCKENAREYIRLTGFGNAVGLLASKGLPGFKFMMDNAIDLDKLEAAVEARGGGGGGGGGGDGSAQ